MATLIGLAEARQFEAGTWELEEAVMIWCCGRGEQQLIKMELVPQITIDSAWGCDFPQSYRDLSLLSLCIFPG